MEQEIFVLPVLNNVAETQTFGTFTGISMSQCPRDNSLNPVELLTLGCVYDVTDWLQVSHKLCKKRK